LVELETPCSVNGEELSYAGLHLFIRAGAEIVNGKRLISTRGDLRAWSTIVEEEEPTPKDIVARQDEVPGSLVAPHVQRFAEFPNNLFDVDTRVG
jgi:hypothetical protein